MSNIKKDILCQRLRDVRSRGYTSDGINNTLADVLRIPDYNAEKIDSVLIHLVQKTFMKSRDKYKADIVLMALRLLDGYEDITKITDRRESYLRNSDYMEKIYSKRYDEFRCGDKEVQNKVIKETSENLRKAEDKQIEALADEILMIENLTDYVKSVPDRSIHPLPSYISKIEEPAGDDIVVKQRSAQTKMRILNSMPVPLEKFTDRDDKMIEIVERLQKFGWVLVSGIGGIGKTELVKVYIHRNRKKYNTVCFLRYDGSLVSTIGLSLPIIGYENDDEDIELRYNTKMALLKSYGEDTLIVIDSFDRTKSDSGKYVSAVFDRKFNDLRSGNYHIIFTSRVVHDGCLELSELESLYQNELFFKYCTKEFSENDRRAITGILDIISGHTLTLVLIAKTLFNGRRVSPEALLKKLSANLKTDIITNVTLEKDGEICSDLMYAHIESVFDISHLSENEKYILTNMVLTPNVGIKAETFGDWIHLDDFNEFDALVDTGWINLDRKTDVASLHPVVSDVLANVLKPNSVSCERYLTSLNGYLSTLDRGNDGVVLNLAMELCSSVLKRVPEKRIVTGRILYSLGKINNRLSMFYDSQKHLLEALSIFEAENQENMDQNELAGLYRWVGISYADSSKNKTAIEYYKKAQNIYETIECPDYRDYARTLNVLGSSSKVLGSYSNALQYHTDALKLQQEYLPENDSDIASTFNYLGMYYNSQGEYDLSLPEFLKSLEIRKDSPLANQRDIAESLNNMAWVYSKKGYLDDALKYYSCALDIKEGMLPENHSAIALGYYNIGHIYELKSDLDVAWKYYQKALKIREELNIENKPRTAAVCRGLSSICRKKKQFEEALVWIDRAVEIYNQNGREKSPKAAITYDNKGYICMDMDNLDEAMVYFEMAFDIREEKLDSTHPMLSDSYCNFADIYLGKKHYETAIEFYQKALKIRLPKFPESHTKILSLYKSLASAYQSIGENEKANEYHGKANISAVV